MLYKAFISYSHAADEQLAPALQSALHRFAKPFYQLRAVRVFRDKTSLYLTPGLWPLIQEALKESEFFILLASPDAAQSQWVQAEINEWLKLRNGSVDKLLIVLTEGEIEWDRAADDFDWDKTTALPLNIKGAFEREPLYTDLRWAKKSTDLSLRNPQFLDDIGTLGATLHGRSKDELVGSDVRQHRIFKLVAAATAMLLLILAIGATGAAIFANEQRKEAERQTLEAQRQRTEAEQQRQNALEAAERERKAAENERVARENEAQQRKKAEQATENERIARQQAEERRKYAERQTEIALSKQLAAQAQLILDQQSGPLVRGLLLATEAMRLHSSSEPDQVIRQGLDLLPATLSYMLNPRAGRIIAVSPNGQSIATADWDGARVWEPATGKQVAYLPHKGLVSGIAFAPDSQLLATAGQDGAVGLLKVTGEEVARTTHGRMVQDVAFSPDGEWIATASVDHTARLWKVTPGQGNVQMQHSLQHKFDVNVVAFSHNGKWLATGSRDGTARIWEVNSGDEIKLMQHRGSIEAIAFSPDGQWLATASSSFGGQFAAGSGSGGDGTARVWNASTGHEIARMQHNGDVKSLAFSRDGKWLATGSRDGTARIWEAGNGREILRVEHRSREYPPNVDGLAFSPNGELLATAGGLTVHVWATKSGKELARMEHDWSVHSVVFHPEGNWLATVSGDNTVRVWKVADQEVRRLTRGPALSDVAFDLERRWIATASGNSVLLWNPQTDEKRTLEVNHKVSALAVSRNLDRVATTGDRFVRVWDTSTGKLIKDIPHDTRNFLGDLAFSPDETLLATASDYVILWDLESGNEIARLGPDSYARSLEFSRDGKRLAAFHGDGTIRIWDVVDRRERVIIRETRKGEGGTVLALSPDGKYLATGRESELDEFTVTLRDSVRGQVIARIQHGHQTGALGFSPDSRQLATYSTDRTIRIWDIATLRQIAGISPGEDVTRLAFSADGRWLVTAHRDNTVRAWLVHPKDLVDIACERVIRNLTLEEWKQHLPGVPYRATCSNLPVDPAAKLAEAELGVKAGKRKQAAAAYEVAAQLAADTRGISIVDRFLRNIAICESGAFNGFAKVVMPSCQLVTGSDYYPEGHIVRALARALTNDYSRAAEDLEAHVNFLGRRSSRSIDPDKEGFIRKLQTWVSELKAGRNPFDLKTIEALRKEIKIVF